MNYSEEGNGNVIYRSSFTNYKRNIVTKLGWLVSRKNA